MIDFCQKKERESLVLLSYRILLHLCRYEYNSVNIAYFAVAEGWLLLDIGWFALFMFEMFLATRDKYILIEYDNLIGILVYDLQYPS